NVRSGARSARTWEPSMYTATLKSALVTNVSGGTYTASVWSRAGGTFSTRELQVYINGTLAHQQTIAVTSSWTAYSISGITVPAGAAIEVGIALDASSGAWTQFDGFAFRKD